MLPIILAALALMATDSEPAVASDPKGQGQEAHALLAKMRASRDLLRSGTYRASGRILTNNGAPDPGPLQGDIQLFSAFDFDKELFRFDQTRPVFRQFGEHIITDQDTGKYVRTPEFAITWMSPWKQKNMARATAVGIHPPSLKPRRVVSWFDVRSLGLILWDDLMAGIPFSTSYEIWDKSRWVEVFPEANGIYRLRLVLGHRSGTYVPQTLWLDEHQGFSPVRLSYRLASANPDQPDAFNFDCQVRWKQEAGVWVPTSFRIEKRARGRLIEFYALGFEWASVNKPVQRELFTPDGLGVPVGTAVFDYRVAVPRRIGQVKGLAPPK